MPISSFTADHLTGLTTALVGRYRIERELGTGGMATVWLAEDLRHGRPVAIKVLHPELSAMLGPERFLAEIRTTASLQHPHILPLFDSGTADGLLYYVMPYVAGETLRRRLEREAQLPVAEALRIASEMADALDYAHRHGIVHRDIKPENILLHDGRALVADFGIALAVKQAGGQRMTQTGMSLGTPQYMSPEQAMGERTVDARSDIYALGAITYEMLAGEPPFTGPTAQAIVAQVITADPRPLASLRSAVPPHVETAVHTALQKLPADRFGAARELAEALRRPSDSLASRDVASIRRTHGSRSARALPWVAAAVATAVALSGWLRPQSGPAMPPSRLAILAPGLGGTGGTTSQRHLALTPDGGSVLYTVQSPDGFNRLVRQPLEATEPLPMPGLRAGIADPVIAPDGRSMLGMVYGERQMYRYPIMGGTEEPIPVEPGLHANAAWDGGGSLWFSPGGVGLARLGPKDSVIRPFGHQLDGWQLRQVVPGDRLALMIRSTRGSASGPVALVDLRSGETTTIVAAAVTDARYTAGYLVYVLPNGVMNAAELDLGRRSFTGGVVPLATNVAVTGSGRAQLAVSDNGTVAYIPEESPSLVFVSRDGTARPALESKQNFHSPEFSPDGRRLALDITGADGRDVWILSLDGGTLSRATFERDAHDAIWSPDGRFISFMSARSGVLGVYRVRPGNAAPPESLYASPKVVYPWSVSGPAGIVVTTANDLFPESGYDIATVANGGRGRIEPLVATRFTEQYPSVSPDGRWLAFSSDQSGRPEVYVRELAGDGETVQVSQAGGSEPRWGPDGRELFYRAGEGRPQLISATVRPGERLEVTSRRALFEITEMLGANPHANYSISPDGQTFAMVRRSPATRIMVIQNLPELVRRLRAGSTAGR